MTEDDLADGLRNVGVEILGGSGPPGRLRYRKLHSSNDIARVRAREDVAPAFESLGGARSRL